MRFLYAGMDLWGVMLTLTARQWCICPSASSIPAQTTQAGCGTEIAAEYGILPINQQKQVLLLEDICQSQT